jgi:hypothetical protein
LCLTTVLLIPVEPKPLSPLTVSDKSFVSTTLTFNKHFSNINCAILSPDL